MITLLFYNFRPSVDITLNHIRIRIVWPRFVVSLCGTFCNSCKFGRGIRAQLSGPSSPKWKQAENMWQQSTSTILMIFPPIFNLPTLWWNYSMYSFYNILYLFITWRLRTQQENPLKSAPFQYTFSCGCWTRDAMQECRRESKWTMNERILNPRWLRVASSYLTA